MSTAATHLRNAVGVVLALRVLSGCEALVDDGSPVLVGGDATPSDGDPDSGEPADEGGERGRAGKA